MLGMEAHIDLIRGQEASKAAHGLKVGVQFQIKCFQFSGITRHHTAEQLHEDRVCDFNKPVYTPGAMEYFSSTHVGVLVGLCVSRQTMKLSCVVCYVHWVHTHCKEV